MKKIIARTSLLIVVAVVSTIQVYSQSSAPSSNNADSGYSAGLLNTKRIFSRGLAEAIGEPFRGVATSDGVVSDLFPLKSTGASTASIVSAASSFLSTLSDAELSRTQYAVDDPEWQNWSNVDVGIFSRHGVSLEEMSEQQKTAAWDLLRASLSAEGVAQTQDIMKTEQSLLELNGEPIRYGEEKYYFHRYGYSVHYRTLGLAVGWSSSNHQFLRVRRSGRHDARILGWRAGDLRARHVCGQSHNAG